MKPLAIIVAAALAATPPVAAPATSESSSSSCIELGGLSPWGVRGFTHIVFLTNRCPETFKCTVSTDVDPTLLQAIAPGNATVQVVTAVESPQAVFIPNVTCN